MFYSGVDRKFRGAKGEAIFINNKWQQKIQECHCEGDRIIYMKIKYNRGQLIVLHAYTPEEGKKDETRVLS